MNEKSLGFGIIHTINAQKYILKSYHVIGIMVGTVYLNLEGKQFLKNVKISLENQT